MGSSDGKRNRDESDPFLRLEQTHRRLEQRLAELERAADDIANGIGPRAALEDIEAVAHFLSRGAVRHVEDEEHTLFPRLAGIRDLEDVVRSLSVEHEEHKQLESEVLSLVRSWDGEVPNREDARKLKSMAEKLRGFYLAHIKLEEEELFPKARRALAPELIREMGLEMMDRRPDRGKKD